MLFKDDKELLTEKEYFIKGDYLEYKCLKCGHITKCKFESYMASDCSCKGCRAIMIRKDRWEYILSLASESDAIVLSNFDDYINNDSRIEVQCSCGNKFTVVVSEFIYGNKRQCNDCGIALKSGENAPRWKGGITPENERLRSSKEYIHWRNALYKRDHYTCQCCGDSSGHNLNGHHILGFSDYPELRFDIKNGITLCESCHNPNKDDSFHNLYGTHENTKEQLQEYMNNRRESLGLPYVDIDDIVNK